MKPSSIFIASKRGAPNPGYAAFEPMLPIPTVVSRSTNEVLCWHVGSLNGHSILPYVPVAENGPGEAYSILGAPVAPWTDDCLTNQNAWVSALDFAITNACEGATSATNALADLTRFLFSGHGLSYDTAGGRSSYFHFNDPTDPDSCHWFDMTRYFFRGNGAVVNCYDQAYGVSLLGRLIGVESDIVFLEPFGYINETDLVGVKNCNSPFFTPIGKPPTPKLCDSNDVSRTWFLNHRYVIRNGKVFDACAGPVLGTMDHNAYLANAVDTSTPQEHGLTFFQFHPRIKGKIAGDIANKEIDSFVMEVQ